MSNACTKSPQAHDAPHDPDQQLLKAVAELAAENADLYRKTGETDPRHEDGAGSIRHLGQGSRPATGNRLLKTRPQMAERLDKVMAMNKALADRMTDLEEKLADQSPVTSAGGTRAADRGRRRGVARQNGLEASTAAKKSRTRSSASGTMGVSTAATVHGGRASAQPRPEMRAGIGGNAPRPW